MKRVILFLATNIAVLLLISIIFQAFGLERMFAEQGVGINFEALLIFSALFGMGGAFISLLLSKKIAKWTLKLRIIERPGDAEETWLLETVRRQAQQAGIGMPEVGIYEGPEMNAFATGARRDDALVAVSRGLLQRMSRDEVEAVLGHEVSHVANGDMITMALIQGVLNTFVIFLSRVIGYVVDKLVLKNERGFGIGYFVTVIAAQILLGILAAMIVNWFSRQREFRADAGGARLAGREKMIAALERLGGNQDSQLPDQMKAFGISGHVGRGFKRLFMSHPPIPERVQALRQAPTL